MLTGTDKIRKAAERSHEAKQLTFSAAELNLRWPVIFRGERGGRMDGLRGYKIPLHFPPPAREIINVELDTLMNPIKCGRERKREGRIE